MIFRRRPRKINLGNCHMVGITRKQDPVWQERGKRRKFLLQGEKGELYKRVWFRWTWKALKPPLFIYDHVALINERATTLLQAFRDGPVYRRGGVVYSRANKPILTKKFTFAVMHWMKGCGYNFIETEEKNGRGARTKIDLDIENLPKIYRKHGGR